jgi:plasmid stabilization system protein ParE
MVFEVLITNLAESQLNDFVDYILQEFQNVSAAKSVWDDATQAMSRLADAADSLVLCENETLAKYGYRRIFFAHHDIFWVYRIEGNRVIIDGTYHKLQDYSSIFIKNMELK